MEKKKPDDLQEEETVDKTVVTKIEKIEKPTEREAYILFMSGPLQGKLHCLEKNKTVIGRDDSVDIQIKDIRISRQHFQINIIEGVAVLEDLGSTNGTYVNGQRIKSHTLIDGDKIQIPGSVVIKFAYGDKGEQMFHEEFYHMANFDAVTGASSRHYFMKRLDEEFSYAKRTKIPLSLLMIDIDFFKKVNDNYGHLAGDLALNHIAKQINQTIRSEDILGRYGGEEFAVILRGIDNSGAVQLAERIRRAIEANPMKFEDQNIRMTVSIGVSTLAQENYNVPKELIDIADQCLYTAKESGRNRVVTKNR
jgi:diguanylate cyclase (GGDEF)-like protein